MTKSALQLYFASDLVLSIIFGGVLQLLWGLINSLQMIVLTVLFTVLMPQNCNVVLISIMNLINLDIIPIPEFLEANFDFVETESYN